MPDDATESYKNTHTHKHTTAAHNSHLLSGSGFFYCIKYIRIHKWKRILRKYIQSILVFLIPLTTHLSFFLSYLFVAFFVFRCAKMSVRNSDRNTHYCYIYLPWRLGAFGFCSCHFPFAICHFHFHSNSTNEYFRIVVQYFYGFSLSLSLYSSSVVISIS